MSTSCELPLQRIKIDANLQPRRDGLVQSHIESLMETPEEWPAIYVVPSGDVFTLVDGFHRYHAASRLGAECIRAMIIEPQEGADLFRLAFELNAAHGMPLSLRDRKAYAARLIQNHPAFGDREIGRRAGLNHETVGALRNEGSGSPYRAPHVPAKKPGEIEADINLADPIRWARGATRPQKATAGYLKRLAASLNVPYADDDAAVEGWCNDPLELAAACFASINPAKADALLANLEFAAGFIARIGHARKDPTLRTLVKKGK
jgi:ParB-like chromosome segregation protein Spo0J